MLQFRHVAEVLEPAAARLPRAGVQYSHRSPLVEFHAGDDFQPEIDPVELTR